ncbi:acetyltransferase [Thiohalomonas denitrificans]|uniref:DHHA1 domain-containing protein n=1 Tax=Thiohalomonas denitrificans TaxID=415747 RepID=A0A1G5QZ39_9GAMM|nr:acetyltransferase [Thiohalomonas denitrificans]SCZ67073.1 DHHA1 domain-containing protein [Thiohalomonas denitrificans]
MTDYDVFNGDADGICALHQLRLHEPADDAVLVTGVKRDIALLGRVDAGEGDRVTVLDVSFDKNRDGVNRLLKAGAAVRYIDHHYAGEIPEHPNLEVLIDTASDVCTALLVNARLEGRYRPWAVAAAFGDNLTDAALRAAGPLKLDDVKLESLKELGICLNYNGYGTSIDDLFFAPDDLYRRIRPYADPFVFMSEDPAYEKLREGFHTDMERAESLRPELESEAYAVYVLPDAKWSRRVGGVYGNALARRHPERAHALLSMLPDGNYQVSVRAPTANPEGADELCRQFPTGGGRKAAAGINALPANRFDAFIDRLKAQFE